MKHPVSFVSLGPGDPDLITLKSLKALQCADIIFCPATAAKDGTQKSRAAALLKALPVSSPLRFFTLPMCKDREAAREVYDGVFEQVKALYGQGKRIAVAVEGDASIYASVHYVLERLTDSAVPTVQLPGIPSFIAAANEAALHLIRQEEKLAVIPGNATIAELEHCLQNHCVPVIMKLSQCAETAKQFMRLHPEYAYHYWEEVGTEHSTCLQDRQQIIERKIPYFSLLIIKKQP